MTEHSYSGLPSENIANYKHLIEKLNLVENEEDLISLLIMPELREDNNPDLPFTVNGRLRANACDDFIQALLSGHLSYFREDGFVAEWMEKLTKNQGIHCFDEKLGIEYTYPDGGHLYVNVQRNNGTSSLTADLDGRPDETLEIWKQGCLVHSRNWSPSFEPQSIPIQDGTALHIRRGSAQEGIEVLVDTGEFGSREWKALLAGLCVRGDFRKAIQLLETKMTDLFNSTQLGCRFQNFLKNLKSHTKVEGYALLPIPAIRGEAGICPDVDTSGCGDIDSIPNDRVLVDGWKDVEQRDFDSAERAFEEYHSQCEGEWSLPLESMLASHLKSISDTELHQKERLLKTTDFWEKIYIAIAT